MEFKCIFKGKQCENADGIGECLIGCENCNNGKIPRLDNEGLNNLNFLCLWDDFDFDAEDDL